MKAVYKKHTKARELVYVRGQHLELPDHMTKDEALRPHMLQAPGSASRFVFFLNTRIEHWHGVRNEVDGEPLNIRVCTVNDFSASGGCMFNSPVLRTPTASSSTAVGDLREAAEGDLAVSA